MEKPTFKLITFEGPLDLLLHLIAKNKVSIYDIPIASITGQYMDYLEEIKSFDLNISSEFLVMAAELLYIKSKMLLPKQETSEDEEDPRDELVKKLLEYQRYKQMLPFLRDKEFWATNLYFKRPEPIDKSLIKIPITEMPLEELISAFHLVLDRIERKAPPSKQDFSGIVKRETVSVHSMAIRILSRFKSAKKLSFHELFSDLNNKAQVISTFLGLLELIKARRLNAKKVGDTIVIYVFEVGDSDGFYKDEEYN